VVKKQHQIFKDAQHPQFPLNSAGTGEFGSYWMELGKLHKEQLHLFEFKYTEGKKPKARSNVQNRYSNISKNKIFL